MLLRTPQRLLLIAGTASALALMPAAASAAAAPGQYTTIDVPGATTTLAVGVNDLGVVSGFYADGNGNDHGFLDRDGTFTTINVPGAAGTVLTVVNDLADKIIVLDHGEKIAEGTAEQVHSNPLVLEAYLGRKAAHHA